MSLTAALSLSPARLTSNQGQELPVNHQRDFAPPPRRSSQAKHPSAGGKPGGKGSPFAPRVTKPWSRGLCVLCARFQAQEAWFNNCSLGWAARKPLTSACASFPDLIPSSRRAEAPLALGGVSAFHAGDCLQEPALDARARLNPPSEGDADTPGARLGPFWDAASPSLGFSSLEGARVCSLGEDTWVFPAITMIF